MNLFDAHSESLAQLRAEYADPVAGATPGNPNTVTIGGAIPATYVAIVGIFEVMQMLTDGGTTPILAAPVTIRRADVPADISFATGRAITVTSMDGR